MAMNPWNLDFTLVITYLFITLIVGILQGRGVRTVQQYAIADRNYRTITIVATITATVVDGGAIMGLSERIISHGLIFALIFLGEPATRVIMAKFVAPKMTPFQGMISVGDIMNKFYGKVGRVVTGVAATLLSVGYIGAQASAIGYIFSFFLDISYVLGVIIACGSIMIYSTFGGIKSVTATDVIQCGILIIAIPTVANIVINVVGGYESLWAALPATHKTFIPEIGAIRYLFIGVIFYLPFLNPAITQRLLMAKDPEQIKRSMYITAIIETPFYFYICIMALAAITLNPDILPNEAIPFLLDNVMPPGLKGIMIVAILAIIMSTADSYLNVASINIIHDVCNPLRKKPMTDQQELKYIRLSSMFIGIFAILVAISFESVIDIMLTFLGIWGPVIAVPLFAGIFGFKANAKSFVMGAIAGGSISMLWISCNLEYFTYLDPLIPGVVANAIMFFGSHYVSRRYLAAA